MRIDKGKLPALPLSAVSVLLRLIVGSQTKLSRHGVAGPGKATIFSRFARRQRSKYTGAKLRALRAERGVGRLPKKEVLS